MRISVKIISVGAAVLGLAGCMSGGPGWTHAKPLADGTGTAVYDCGALQGADAGRALAASHNLYYTKYHAKMMARQARLRSIVQQQRAGMVISAAEVQDINAKTLAIKTEVAQKTAALGCTFKGHLAGAAKK